MPRCEKCEKSVPSYDLKYVNTSDGQSTVLVCNTCRTPEEVVTGYHETDRQVAAVSLHQYETADGKKDYRVQAEATIKGLEVSYKANFEDVRKFFKDGAKKRAELKAV